MKYILVDAKTNGDEYDREFATAREAIDAGNDAWAHLTAAERGVRDLYVIESVHPDSDGPEHYDGNICCTWTTKRPYGGRHR